MLGGMAGQIIIYHTANIKMQLSQVTDFVKLTISPELQQTTD